MHALETLRLHLIIGRGVEGRPIHVSVKLVRGRTERVRYEGYVNIHLAAVIRLIPE